MVNLRYFTLKQLLLIFSPENIVVLHLKCVLLTLDLINIYTDTKTTKIGAFIAKSQAHPVFRAVILNFEF